jgi:menaquinol-cytochrome c reductase iron-sulfur subunit
MNRRRWLAALIGLGGAVLGGVAAVPAVLAALTPALRPRRGRRWRAVGPLEDFSLGNVEKVIVPLDRGDWSQSLSEKAVYVWRRSEEEVIIYSRNCTDLSCPVNYDAGSECFFCPCHGGIFAKDGRPMAGPPSRPLYRYANRVRDGVLEIDLNSLPPMT